MKYKDRYILATGYPYALNLRPYTDICMQRFQKVGRRVRIEWPEELWNADLPRYRLVLERVKK